MGIGITANHAIFDPDAPKRILEASRDELDWGIAWCCVRRGMHPKNIRDLRPRNLDQDGYLAYRRAKNEEAMQSIVPEQDLSRLRAFLEEISRKRPTEKTIWLRMRQLTDRAGFKGGPRVLRKTFIINELRRLRSNPDRLLIVSKAAGCSVRTLAQYYLLLSQWEEIRAK